MSPRLPPGRSKKKETLIFRPETEVHSNVAAAEEGGGKDIEKAAKPEKDKIKKKRSILKFIAWFSLLLLVFLLAGGLYLWLFPQSGQRIWQRLFPCCPLIGNILDGKTREQFLDKVRIKDIRQRYINNCQVGNIRVIEGAAVNSNKHSLTRIQVRGKLYDAENRVIAQQLSYCGNLLTEAELSTFTEEGIQRELALPQGSDISNDRIHPNALIPFMIVFVHDRLEAVKTTVMTAGAEKLL